MTSSTLNPGIFDSIAPDMAAVNSLIIQEIASPIPLIQEIAQHLIKSGGKRLRPMVVLLSARALDCNEPTEVHELAVILEFIHSATLLHDDVIDESTQRRGQATANAIWDNSAAVLVGDFLYSRAFQILARRSNIPVMKVLADATNRLSEAEVLQLSFTNNPDITEQNYFDVIDGKTAQLYAAAAQVGAMVAADDAEKQMALRNFGWHLGMAFQIIDDVLDYSAKQDKLGKNLGDDLAEGKTTLPLIYALKNANLTQQKIIRDAIINSDQSQFSEIIGILNETKALELSAQTAYRFAQKAQKDLSIIQDSPYKTALLELTGFVLNRDY